MANRKVKTGEKVVQFPLWPDQNGTIQLPKMTVGKQTSPLITSPSERRESYLQLSLPLRRARVRGRSRTQFFTWSSLWLRLRLSIGLSSHRASPIYFAQWLLEKVDENPFGAVDVTGAIEGAQKELGLERETAIRYLLQHTRIDADFKSDGDIITLR